MALLSDNTKKALEACIGREIPFFMYRRPGSDKCVFFSSPEDLSDSGEIIFHAAIKPWDEPAGEIHFHGILNLEKTLGYIKATPDIKGSHSDANIMRPCRRSTLRGNYEDSLNTLIPALRRENRKTVISTVICGKSDGVRWPDVGEALFLAFPQAMGFFYYTPETGFWLGATPEVLLRHDGRRNVLETMALAGTRAVSECGEWDEKNIQEHGFVRDYILDKMKGCGLTPECDPMDILRYGSIEHLHTGIKARIDSSGSTELYLKVLSALHPTPALCGFPRRQAMDDIKAIEEHPRHCYGGYIRISEDGPAHDAYVILRCVHFDRDGWCVYAGGGIVGESDPASEWEETRRKASALLETICSAKSK